MEGSETALGVPPTAFCLPCSSPVATYTDVLGCCTLGSWPQLRGAVLGSVHVRFGASVGEFPVGCGRALGQRRRRRPILFRIMLQIWTIGTTRAKPGDLSAYSIFNPGQRAIGGTLSSAQIEVRAVTTLG